MSSPEWASAEHVGRCLARGWLRTVGSEDADCHWKWLEMALLIGVKPAEP